MHLEAAPRSGGSGACRRHRPTNDRALDHRAGSEQPAQRIGKSSHRRVGCPSCSRYGHRASKFLRRAPRSRQRSTCDTFIAWRAPVPPARLFPDQRSAFFFSESRAKTYLASGMPAPMGSANPWIGNGCPPHSGQHMLGGNPVRSYPQRTHAARAPRNGASRSNVAGSPVVPSSDMLDAMTPMVPIAGRDAAPLSCGYAIERIRCFA